MSDVPAPVMNMGGGMQAPMPLTWAPGFNQAPFSTATSELVTVTTMSAPVTASSALMARPPTSAASFSAFASVRLQIRISVMSRTWSSARLHHVLCS